MLNTHYVDPVAFTADLKDQDSGITQDEIDREYSQFLRSVESSQKNQMRALRHLIKEHNLKAVYVEGVTEQNRIDQMELGAAGRLVVSGELQTILPAEDSAVFKAANPVQPDVAVDIDREAEERCEDAIVRNLMKADGVAVIILGGGHDLSDNIKRNEGNCKYERVAAPKYKEVTK